MIAKIYKLKLDHDFERAFKAGRSLYGRFLGIKIIKNDQPCSRFGVILGLKIDKSAVRRHHLKRQIFDVLAQVLVKLPFSVDCVIIALPAIKEAKDVEIKQELLNIFSKISSRL